MDHIIYRDYAEDRRFFIYCSLATVKICCKGGHPRHIQLSFYPTGYCPLLLPSYSVFEAGKSGLLHLSP